MGDPEWRIKMQNLGDWDKIQYSEIIGVAHYESERNIHELKMADIIWLTKIQKITRSEWKGLAQ